MTSKLASVAQIFSKFFANLAGKLLKLLPAPMKKYGYESVDTFYKNKIPSGTSFHLVEVDQDYITNVLQNLSISKAPGIDNIPALFLHDGVSVLCKPITQLVNLSISVAEFPNKCKVAKVKPLFKKGSKIEPQNYRPISLLPVMSKVFEQVIHEQTQTFLENHNLFLKFPSGFRKKHSTDTCLSYLWDKIATGFDQGKYTGMIMIDLQKTFNTLDRSILIQKMKALCFSKGTILWFKSYLANRSFCIS